MPSFGHTPEAFFGRSDSRNPSTTCRGITSSGRACRRNLGEKSKFKSQGTAAGGVVTIVQGSEESEDARFYCWQHQDQARAQVSSVLVTTQENQQRRTTILFPLREQSSIDTLAERLGVQQGPHRTESAKVNARPEQSKPRRPNQTPLNRPPNRPDENKEKPNTSRRARPRPRKVGFWASLCCVADSEEDYIEVVRHRKRVERDVQGRAAASVPSHSSPKPVILASDPNAQRRDQVAPRHEKTAPVTSRTTALSGRDHGLDSLWSYIPPSCSPQSASALLAELTKPISPSDEEGYIYIFWLTPQSRNAPPEATAKSLLAPERPRNERRISDVMTEFSYDGEDDLADRLGHRRSRKKTIMVKIGRASNVTRRMNEWQRQCGYALTLVRWYPYVSSKSNHSLPHPSPHEDISYPDLSRPPMAHSRRTSDNVENVLKVPNVKRVERLIHLELASQRVSRKCEMCHKDHREWFEIEASQAGVKAVDETIRRWVGWSERQTNR